MFKRENNAGLYLTIIFHLTILIVFLIIRISSVVREESSFVLDFTKQDELEAQIKREQIREEVSKELDDILSGRASNIRNAVVDANSKGSALKDDRFKNPSQVYDEAQKLQQKLDASKREAEANQGGEEVANPDNKKVDKKEESYKGPSVISYSLDGRKAMSLPIPVYKCMGGGDVSILIIVNRRGYVIDAAVINNASSSDECLREYAIKAAKSSRFTASNSAPEKQRGEIVYRFIAQ